MPVLATHANTGRQLTGKHYAACSPRTFLITVHKGRNTKLRLSNKSFDWCTAVSREVWPAKDMRGEHTAWEHGGISSGGNRTTSSISSVCMLTREGTVT